MDAGTLDGWMHGCMNGWVISPTQQSQTSQPLQFLQTIPIPPTPCNSKTWEI